MKHLSEAITAIGDLQSGFRVLESRVQGVATVRDLEVVQLQLDHLRERVDALEATEEDAEEEEGTSPPPPPGLKAAPKPRNQRR